MIGRLISDKEAFRIARAASKFKGKTSHSVRGISVRYGRVIMNKGKFVRFEEEEQGNSAEGA